MESRYYTIEWTCSRLFCAQKIVCTFDRLDPDPFAQCSQCGAVYTPAEGGNGEAIQLLSF